MTNARVVIVLLTLWHFSGSTWAESPNPRITLRIQQLKDPDPMVRCNAEAWLEAWSRDPRALDPLLEQTGDKNQQCAQTAALAAGVIGDLAVGPLAAELRSPDVQVRYNAMAGLALTKTQAGTEALVSELHNPDVSVQVDAAKILGRTGDVRVIPILIEYIKKSTQGVPASAVEGLADVGKDHLEVLTGYLGDSNVRVRRGVVEALSQIPNNIETTDVAAALLGALNDPDIAIRALAIKALEYRKDSRVIDPLIKLLRDPKNPDLEATANVIAVSGDPRATTPLLNLLTGPDVSTRRIGANAILQLGLHGSKDPLAVEPLFVASHDPDSQVRDVAIDALAAFSDPRSVDPLLLRLKSSAPEHRSDIVRSLGLAGDSRAVTPLLALMASRDSGVSVTIVDEALGTIGDQGATVALLAQLATTDETGLTGTRRAAVAALLKIKDPRAIQSLIPVLKERDYVHQSAAQAIGAIGEASVTPLLAHLEDTDIHMRVGVLRALGFTQARSAIEPLIAALSDKDPIIRQNAAAALALFQEPDVIHALIRCLGDANPRVALFASQSLAYINGPAVPDLVAALKDPKVDVQRNAAQALSKTKDPRAAAALNAALANHEVEILAGGYSFFVQRARPTDDDGLIEALDRSGDVSMAYTLLRSKDPRLQDAARAWYPKTPAQERVATFLWQDGDF